MSNFVMPIRWNEEDMTQMDILHKNLQMNFMWSDYFINKGDIIMFNKCQNDINNIRLTIKQLKQQPIKINSKQFKNKSKI